MTMADRQIFLTRPRGENEELSSRLQSLDGRIEFVVKPLIEVTPIDSDPALKKMIMDLDQYDDLIFISKSAARVGLDLLDQYWPQWPVNLRWYAVGPGTAEVLAESGITAEFPGVPGSEGLLQLPGLISPQGRRVLIMRGRGGREHLAEVLRERGATVDYGEAYIRSPIAYSDWQVEEGDVVILTSGEALDAFAGAVTLRDGITIITVSARTQALARSAGFSQVMNAGGASDQALYDAISDVLNEKSG